jgi:hypothetical protein
MMLPPNRSVEDLDIDDVLQGIGFSLLFAFLALFAKLTFPVALLQPEWQLRFGETLRTTASIPLAGTALLLLAEFINPDSQILAQRVLWVRRLSVAAALGFFLLIPMQISAGLRDITRSTIIEYRELRALQQAAGAIQQAVTPQQMFNAIKLLPGLPPDYTPALDTPIPAIRTSLLSQIRLQIVKLEARIGEARRQRIQGAITLFAFDAVIALAYGVGFAAIGRSASGRPTLLQQIIGIPSYLQRGFRFYGEALLRLPSLLPRLPRFRWPRWPSNRSGGGRLLPSQTRRRTRHRRPWFRLPFFRPSGPRRSSVRHDTIPQEWLDESDHDSGRSS